MDGSKVAKEKLDSMEELAPAAEAAELDSVESIAARELPAAVWRVRAFVRLRAEHAEWMFKLSLSN